MLNTSHIGETDFGISQCSDPGANRFLSPRQYLMKGEREHQWQSFAK